MTNMKHNPDTERNVKGDPFWAINSTLSDEEIIERFPQKTASALLAEKESQ